jgi:hypothetical protein
MTMISCFPNHIMMSLESSDDLMINLFKAYLCVTDHDVVHYMRNKKYAYDDGEDFSVDQLFTMSLIKFQIVKDSGKWNSLSPEQEHIVALTSEVTALKDHNLKLTNDSKAPKNKKYGEKAKGAGKGKTPIKRQHTRRSGSVRISQSRREIPSPSRCLALTKCIIGVRTTTPGLFTLLFCAQPTLPAKRLMRPRHWLHCLRGLNLMSGILGISLVPARYIVSIPRSRATRELFTW